MDLRLEVMAIPATEDTIVEASSVGSINVLMKVWRPRVVESKLRVETYPAVPRPVTVDNKLGEDKKPAVLNCCWRFPVVDIRLRVLT